MPLLAGDHRYHYLSVHQEKSNHVQINRKSICAGRPSYELHPQTTYGSHHDWTMVGLQAASEIETFSLMMIEQWQQDSSRASSASVARWQEHVV